MDYSPSWTKEQIKDHKEAAERLGKIKDEVIQLLENNKGIYEGDVLSYIQKAYKKHGLKNDSKKEFAIVAFGKNTNQVHYFPKGKGIKVKNDSLILIDLWARLDKKNAPYADMTWMLWYRPETSSLNKYPPLWSALAKARDNAIKLIKRCAKQRRLPKGVDIDRVSHDTLGEEGLGHGIKHTIGHSLGLNSPHGKQPGINWREYSPIIKNMGYTIEPGVYLKDFGLRTEIDFYIDDSFNVVITTPVQKSLNIILNYDKV